MSDTAVWLTEHFIASGQIRRMGVLVAVGIARSIGVYRDMWPGDGKFFS